MDNKKFKQTEFEYESDLKKIFKENVNPLLGQDVVYFDIKNKIDSGALGRTIPDGILFDFRDIENPEFYLVEAELSKHDFYRHIFPQITKFFGFFNNYFNN